MKIIQFVISTVLNTHVVCPALYIFAYSPLLIPLTVQEEIDNVLDVQSNKTNTNEQDNMDESGGDTADTNDSLDKVRIVGGSSVDKGNFPFMASLRKSK